MHALFRSSQPYLKLLLLNRQSTSNWTQAIELGVSCGADMASQMLSIRTRDGVSVHFPALPCLEHPPSCLLLQTVSGCWFHDPAELSVVAKCVKDHLKALKAAAASPSTQPQVAAAPPAIASSGSQGIMGLLQSAEAYSTPSATPTKPSYSAAVTAPGGNTGLQDLLNSAAAAASERVTPSTTPSSSTSPQQGPTPSSREVTPLALSKEALKAVMMDMLEEPAFIDELHARFISHLHQQRGPPSAAAAGGQQASQAQSAKKRKPRGKKKGTAQ